MARRRAPIQKRPARAASAAGASSSKSFLSYLPWIAGLGLVGVIVGFAVSAPEKLDPITFCPPEPSGKTVLLIDVSDKLSFSQKARLDNELKYLSDTSADRPNAFLSKGELFVVYFLETEDKPPELLFSMCHPGALADRSVVEKLSQGEMFARKQWEEFQQNTLERIDQRIASSQNAATSPIYETLQYIRAEEFPPPTLVSGDDDYSLLIWSDMIQNSSKENHFSEISQPEAFFKSNPLQMNGINVELMFLLSQKYASSQPDELILWWRKIFALAKAEFNFGFQQ